MNAEANDTSFDQITQENTRHRNGQELLWTNQIGPLRVVVYSSIPAYKRETNILFYGIPRPSGSICPKGENLKSQYAFWVKSRDLVWPFSGIPYIAHVFVSIIVVQLWGIISNSFVINLLNY